MQKYGEHYVLPLSHDEVVHGKATIAQKMASSDVSSKLAQARTLYLYQTAHPGKMLNFMGYEVAQLREWDERREQDWFLRDYPAHDSFFRFCCELNKVYRETPALWELDYDEKGFSWLEADDTENVTYAFLRNAEDGSCVVCALNLSGESAKCELSVPGATSAEVLLHSDWERFGGDTPDDEDGLVVKAGMVALELPACSAVLASLTRTDKKA